MGLLDDAIREHLELKRRRGADPSEIEREETEALGPVRREDAERALEAEPAAGSYADLDDDGKPAGLGDPGAAYDDYEPEPPAPAPAPTAFQDHALLDEPPVTHDAPYAEREDETATPPHGDPLAHQQTREFSATELDEALGTDAPARPAHEPPADVVPGDDADAEDQDEDAEDELEETPDFLQETPEHDRLWFEQKPPKDFDF